MSFNSFLQNDILINIINTGIIEYQIILKNSKIPTELVKSLPHDIQKNIKLKINKFNKKYHNNSGNLKILSLLPEIFLRYL